MTAPRNPDNLIAAFLGEGPTDLPDRAFDAVRRDIHRTRQRVVIGPWREPRMSTVTRLAIAAAVIVAVGVVWINLVPRGGQFGDLPSPSPTASPQIVSGPIRELAPGRYAIDYAVVPGAVVPGPELPGSSQEPGISVVFTLPGNGWTNYDNFAVDRNYGPGAGGAGASLVVWHITNVTVDPCTDHRGKEPAPGPGIDELLLALADQEGIDGSPLTDVTIDGYTGKSVELTITADIDACPQGFFTWGTGDDGRFAQGTNEVVRVYALDVEGQRLTFFGRIPEKTTPALLAELESVIASIDIQP